MLDVQERKRRRLESARKYRLRYPERVEAAKASWKQRNPDYHKSYNYDWYSRSVRNRLTKLLVMAKNRAKKESVPFDLVVDDLFVPEFCPILRTKLAFGGDRNDTPSLDRMVPSVGYVKGNVKLISMRANRLKNNGTIEEFERILAYMKGE